MTNMGQTYNLQVVTQFTAMKSVYDGSERIPTQSGQSKGIASAHEQAPGNDMLLVSHFLYLVHYLIRAIIVLYLKTVIQTLKLYHTKFLTNVLGNNSILRFFYIYIIPAF